VQLNAGSAGAPLYHLELEPRGALPDWQSGDLVQVAAPADPSRPREYSIASIPPMAACICWCACIRMAMAATAWPRAG
jgi:hypothetical protein